MNSEQRTSYESGVCERVLVVRLAKPKHAGEASVGVIVLGIGMADLIAATRFAKNGWPAMQIRLISETHDHTSLSRRYDTYDSSGVSRCKEAMDYLTKTHGVSRFVLMGNCALANICLNTGILDTRVVGLVLTNPYVPEDLVAWVYPRIRRHFFSWQSWLRLFRGKMRVHRGADAEEARLRNYAGDVALPADVARQLQWLVEHRRLRILIAFSRSETALFHFRQYYRKVLRGSAARGLLRFEVLATDCHDFSATEDAADKLNNLIGDWIKTSWSSQRAAA